MSTEDRQPTPPAAWSKLLISTSILKFANEPARSAFMDVSMMLDGCRKRSEAGLGTGVK